MSIYTAGISNVGSYLVSGRPWLKTSTIADGAVEFYHFPKVTKQITVHNDHQNAGHNLEVAFPEPRRAVNMPGAPGDADTEFFSSTFSSSGTVTVGIWFKFETALPSAERILELRDTAGTSSSSLRVQTRSSNKIRLVINNTVSGDSGALLTADTWFHLAVTINKAAPETKIYLNGSLVSSLTDTSITPSSDLGKLFLGGSTANSNGFYSDCTLFNAVLSATEISALYNGVGNIDPRTHSQSTNLVSWWAFEDNFYKNYFAIPDTGTTILDRVGSNNLQISSGAATFDLGRHHASIFNESQSYLLDGQENMTIEAKSTFMSVKCSGGSLDYSIHASLTGIDPERMGRETGLYD
tara:strand:- start:45 stop:1103 length:1059 start_codon:yes stop_codon:yes gene_type:complete